MISPRRIAAQFRKEIVQVRRDRVGLVLAVLLPVFLMTLLGTALSLSVTNIPVVIQDLDQTPLSLQLCDALRNSLTFRVASWPVERPPEQALLAGSARAAVIIPPHFERNVVLRQSPEVQMLIDATDANTANVLRGTFTAVVGAWSAQTGPVPLPTVQGDIRLWYNPGRKDQFYIGPGALVVSLALIPPLLAALAMSRERESGTILQVYVSGVTALDYILGKVAAFMGIAAVDWILGIAVLYGLFGLRLQGNPSVFLAGSFGFLFCVISFGAMVGARISDQPTAVQAMQMTGFLLSFLLSGFMFPLSSIPMQMRWISAIVPARYYMDIVRDAFLQGGGWSAVGLDVAALLGLGSFFFYQTWRGLKRMQVGS